jgi:hypothetical protein
MVCELSEPGRELTPLGLVAWAQERGIEPEPEEDEPTKGKPAANGRTAPPNGDSPMPAPAGRYGDKRVDRARAYVFSPGFPESIEGSFGHGPLYRCACELVDGFGLDRADARPILSDYNQQKARPPESEYQVDHKLDDAIKDHPVPSLKRLNAGRPEVNGRASANGDAGESPMGTMAAGPPRRFQVGDKVICDDRPDRDANEGTVTRLTPRGYWVHFENNDGREATVFVKEEHCHPKDGPRGAGRGVNWSALSDEDMGMRLASEVKRRPIEFLLPGRIPRNDYTLIAGRGKQGKSLFTMAVAAKCSTGGEWWDGSGTAPCGHVLVLAAEDDAERVIAPRLEALGADLGKVTILEAKYKIRPDDGGPPLVSFTSLQDLAYWREIFARVKKKDTPLLMIIDPLPSYVGKGVNDRRNNDVRAILGPFIDLAKEFGITILGVTHFGKAGDARTAADKILDSVAYANLARAMIYVAIDPDDEDRRLVMAGDCSYAPRHQDALIFRVVERTIPDEEFGPIAIAVPEFSAETVEVDPDDIVTRAPKGKGRRGPDAVVGPKLAAWLTTSLRDRGPVLLGEIADEAGQAGLLGEKRWNAKKGREEWSKFTVLYGAVDLVPGLPPPDDGWEVVTSKDDPTLRTLNGRARWLLRRRDSPF